MENGRGEKGNESKVKGKMAKVKRQSENGKVKSKRTKGLSFGAITLSVCQNVEV